MAERISFYKTPVDRELFREITKRRNFPGLVQSLGILGVYAAGVYFSWFFFSRQMWIPMIAVTYVHCMLLNFVGMEASVHELSHFTPFKSKGLNEFFYHLFCFLTWNNPVHFRASHSLHHQYTVHKGLDNEVILEPLSIKWFDYLRWLTFDYKQLKMYIFPTIAHAFGRADVDYFSWNPLFEKDDKRRKAMCNWDRFILIGQLLLLGLFIYYDLWIFIITVNFGYFFVTFVTAGCVLQQHQGLSSNIADWRMTCYTMDYGPFLRFLYWNMNYHIEHHMYAAVPFYNLKKLHHAVSHDTPVPNKGYFKGWKLLRTIQKRQEENPEYCFVPEFPDTAVKPKVS